MKLRGFVPLPFFIPVVLAVGSLLGLVALAVQAAERPKKIEIVIKKGEAKVLTGYAVTTVPAEIVVRNEDTVTHGFNASLFKPTTEVEMTGGYLAPGKKAHVYRVDAGKTMTLIYTPPRMDDNSTFAFWCDMHRSVKGEFIVVQVTGPDGG